MIHRLLARFAWSCTHRIGPRLDIYQISQLEGPSEPWGVQMQRAYYHSVLLPMQRKLYGYEDAE